MPALEPMPEGHVLKRSFYLSQDFLGRFRNGPLWVAESIATDAGENGLPFQLRNDGVTSILIGSNDWAADISGKDSAKSRFALALTC